jgi:hypothetical protein
MRRLHAEGKLEGPAALFMRPTKPVEELYDLQTDPHEVKNLADDPAHREALERLRNAHLAWMRDIGDIGFVPEGLYEAMKWPSGSYDKTATPYFAESDDGVHIHCATPAASIVYRADGDEDWTVYSGPVKAKKIEAQASRLGFDLSEEATYPPANNRMVGMAAPFDWRGELDQTDQLERFLALKQWDGRGAEAIPAWTRALHDEAPAIRYWGAIGLRVDSTTDVQRDAARPKLDVALEDDEVVVRIAAARALAEWDESEAAMAVLGEAIEHPLEAVRHQAMIALYELGEQARPLLPEIAEHAEKDRSDYAGRMARHIVAALEK